MTKPPYPGNTTRRRFLAKTAAVSTAVFTGGVIQGCDSRDFLSENKAMSYLNNGTEKQSFFKISLAQWSLHRTFKSGTNNLEFPAIAASMGIHAVEYVNQFFFDKAEDFGYLSKMLENAKDHDVQNVQIMVDREGILGHKDKKVRIDAIERHYKWVDAAKFLGCHAIRVNAHGKGNGDDVAKRVSESLQQLATYAAKDNINIIVENHGGWSSDAQWISKVMKMVSMSNCGTLPDFGNFTINRFPPKHYDRYQGVKEMLPWAKGVSAKSHQFDENGEETSTNYRRMIEVLRQQKFSGYVGIEYEGAYLSEIAGILATRNLLLRYGQATQP